MKPHPDGRPGNQQQHYVVQPSRGLSSLRLGELYTHRDLIWILVSRDLKTRYRQTALGPLWVVLNPFFNMVVMSFIFGGLARLPSEGVPYPIFLFAAMLPWNFFAMTVNKTTTSLRQYMGWMSKVYIPRLVPPIVAILSGFVDWCVTFLILFGLMFFYKVPPSLMIVTLPLFLLAAFIVGAAIGLISTSISVKYRDFASVVSFGVTIWYYLTPIVYSATLLPPQLAWLSQFNPMFWVVEGFRWALLGIGDPPQLFMLIPTAFFLLLLVGALFFFQHTSRNIVDLQ